MGSAEEHRRAFDEDPVGYGETYLASLSDKGDPSLVQAAYEKIVAAAPKDENWWAVYCSWCEKSLKVPSVALGVYKRAAESCPYVSWIWQGLLGSAERAQEEPEQVDSYWEKAKETIADTESGLCLYRTYIYLLRRRISASETKDYHPVAKIFSEGHKLLEEYFGRDWDPDGQYRRNQAHFLAERLGQVEEARKIWQDILATGGGRLAEKWLEATRFERQYGDVQHARRLLFKALNSVADHPTVIYDYFIQFEREEGSLDELDAALEKVNAQQRHRSQRPQKTVEEPKKKERQEKAGGRKRAGDDTVGPKEKKEKKEKAPQEAIGPVIPVKDKDGFTMPLMSMIRRSPTPERAKPPTVQQPQTSEAMEVDSKWTVFCSNIDFKITAEDIKNALNGATDVRLAQRPGNKQHKGFAYVDFDSEKNMRQALAKDRQITLGQRQMFISINDPSNRASFKYAVGKEKNKIFVRNVHFDCTEEQLRDFFQQFGEVAAVRIVTHKSGKAKGVAYVDFVEEQAAAKACEAEELTLLDRKLIVAISDPPSRNSSSTETPPADSSARRRHLQIVPRAVTKKPAAANGKPAPKNGSGGTGASSGLSNDEFRRKFLGS